MTSAYDQAREAGYRFVGFRMRTRHRMPAQILTAVTLWSRRGHRLEANVQFSTAGFADSEEARCAMLDEIRELGARALLEQQLEKLGRRRAA